MIADIIIILTALIVGVVLFLPRIINNDFWSATITPLASIIGSGFLILGPILIQNFGAYAPLAMILLCLVGFLFGSAIRFNIKMHEIDGQNKWVATFEFVSSWALAFAYIISVTYYLNLFGAFTARLGIFENPILAKIVASIMFLLILIIGWSKGFSALERLEKISVSLKIAIIIGLIIGLILFNINQIAQNELIFTPSKPVSLSLITLWFGLIITIQGFETSRYLGEEYSANTRIKSMRFAQYISTIIYIIYIILITYVFAPSAFGFSETAIIDMMIIVSPILPAMLIIAALSAQLSAALADTSGSGGLIAELTNNKVKQKQAYLILVVIGLLLTWSADIFTIISYASRAFALYYAIQAAIAAIFAFNAKSYSAKFYLYSSLCCLAVAISLFGTAIEV